MKKNKLLALLILVIAILSTFAFAACGSVEKGNEPTPPPADDTTNPGDNTDPGDTHKHVLVHHEADPATCEKVGTIEYWSCTCGKNFSDANGVTEVKSVEQKKLNHRFKAEDYKTDNNATCTKDGTKSALCDMCGKEKNTVPAPGTALGHDFKNYTLRAGSATCIKDGVEESVCSRDNCNIKDVRTKIGSKLAHHIEGNACKDCGLSAEIANFTYSYNKEEDASHIYFGYYPQSEVTDSAIITELNKRTGDNPTPEREGLWNSYGYYYMDPNNIFGVAQVPYMWYVDVVHNGELYRGVYFTDYRPNDTGYELGAEHSYIDDNGYEAQKVYWFKHEQLKWRILQSDNETTGSEKTYVMCESIIDAQEFYPSLFNLRTDDKGNPVYSNNYAYSTIRTWLNQNFYTSAFSALQQALIDTTTVDNQNTMEYPDSEVAQIWKTKNTEDKIFLLSYADVTNEALGLGKHNMSLKLPLTAYSKIQGMYYSSEKQTGGYWLRSPYVDEDITMVEYIRLYECSILDSYANDAAMGVVPAMWLNLKTEKPVVVPPTEAEFPVDNADTQYTEGLTFELSEDETYYIVSKGTIDANAASIKIPAVYNGKPVREIQGFSSVKCTNITIPSSIKKFNSAAFSNVTTIENVYYKGSAELWSKITFESDEANPLYIGYNSYACKANLYVDGNTTTPLASFTANSAINNYAFAGCASLTSLNVLQNVNIGNSAFLNCQNLSSVTLANGVTLGNSVFSRCSSLESMELPASVNYIGDNTFQYCTKLKNVTINGNIFEFGKSAFAGCTALQSIAFDGALDTIGEYAFQGCFKLESVSLPESVTILNRGAFTECSLLTEINLENIKIFYASALNGTKVSAVNLASATEISPWAFGTNSQLNSVTIGKNIKSISVNAFANCPSLAQITYLGTEAEWAKVNLSNGWAASTVKVICSDTQVTPPTPVEEEPTVTITSSDGNITTEDKYVLSYNVTNAEGGVEVTVTGGTNYVYNAETKEFSATEAGTYIITVTATNITKTASDSVTVNVSAAVTPPTPGDEASDGLQYALSQDGTYYIVSKGTFSGTELVIPATHTEGETTLPVKEIAASAFYNSSVVNVTLPASIIAIGNSAFNYADVNTVYYAGTVSDWAKISFGNHSSNPFGGNRSTEGNFYASGDKTNLVTEIILDSTVNVVKQYAFYYFKKVTSITIPASVTTFETNAFNSNSLMESVYYKGDLKGWMKISFASSLSNPTYYGALYLGENKTTLSQNLIIPADSDLKTIGKFTFYNCGTIKSLSFAGNNIVTIGESAFYGTGLNSVTLPASVTQIDRDAFDRASNINTLNYDGTLSNWLGITFGDADANPLSKGIALNIKNGSEYTSVTSINVTANVGAYTFTGCTGITEVNITGDYTIGTDAFKNCNISTLTLAENVTNFDGSKFGTITTLRCESVAQWIALSSGFSESSSSPLYSGATLQVKDSQDSYGDIPATVTISSKVGAYAFYGITTIEVIIINGGASSASNAVVAIGNNAFQNCSGITNITMNGYVSLGSSAFNGCSNLASMTINGQFTSVTNGAFTNCNKFTDLYVSGTTFNGASIFSNFPTSITKVYYNGTLNDWLELSFSSSNMNPLATASALYVKSSEANNSQYAEVTSLNITNAVKANAFYKCTSLTEITLNNGGSFTSNSFTSCTNLKTLKIAADVTSLSADISSLSFNTVEYAGTINDWSAITFGSEKANPLKNKPTTFKVKSLTTDELTTDVSAVVIPSAVTSISPYAFYNLTALKTITIHSGVTSIGKDAFYECSIETVNYSGTIDNWASINFNNDAEANPLYKQTATLFVNYVDDTSKTEVKDSITLTKANAYAFYGYTKITNLTYNGTDAIGTYSFYKCTGLISVTINNCTTINSSAFSSCTSLQTVNFDSNVTTLVTYSFNGCSSLTTVNFGDATHASAFETFGNASREMQWAFYNANTKNLTFNFYGTQESWDSVTGKDYIGTITINIIPVTAE